MSLENLSIDDLYSEIERRKAGEISEIDREISVKRAEIVQLEAKRARLAGNAPKTVVVKAAKSRLSAGERAERVLTALDGRGFTGASELAGLVGFDGNSLRDTLTALSEEGKLVREGKARGTKYKLA